MNSVTDCLYVMSALENGQGMEKWLGDGKWLGDVMVKEFRILFWLLVVNSVLVCWELVILIN